MADGVEGKSTQAQTPHIARQCRNPTGSSIL